MVEIIEKEKQKKFKPILGKEIFGPYERSLISNAHGKEIKVTNPKIKGIEKKYKPLKSEFAMAFIGKIKK